MNALSAAENDRRASRARHYHSAPRGTERMLAGSLLGLMLLVGASSVHAQARGDGARTYWKKPVDTHAVTTTFQINTGNVGFNTDLPITGAVIESTVFIASYTAYFGLLGRTNMVTLALPAGTMSGHTTGVSPVAVDIATKGRADPVLSWDINLIGGPATDVREFASYRQRTVADFNVWITAPLGSYDEDEPASIGTNRWMFRLGFPFVQTLGRGNPGRMTSLEILPSVSFFTVEEGRMRTEQDPLFNLQVHLTRDLMEQVWLSADGIWQKGGATTVDGVSQDNAQSAISVGLTIAYQITPSFRLTSSWGNSVNDEDDGVNMNTITFALSYGWNPTALRAAREAQAARGEGTR